MDKPITIVSRRSPLAVAQAEAVRALLGKAAELPETRWEERFPIRTYITTGDRNMAGSLSEVGGKGLFVKEIEMALLTREGDIAVHSMKDMPAVMPDGLVQAAVPEREDPRDAFVTLDGRGIDDLPEGTRIGTSSVRRRAQLLRRRPDLEIIPFRGNVATRLKKLQEGIAEGTFLAEAGLRRLGRDDVTRVPQSVDVMLPALGQGALCIQTRADDEASRALCARITHRDTELATTVERAFVSRLDGSCRTPMAGHAVITPEGINFRAEVLPLDGQGGESLDETIPIKGSSREEQVLDALTRGGAFAERLLDAAGPELRDVLAGA
jgi:hydroxymethylbilane synthase